MDDLISVIVTAHNRKLYLQDALKSLLNQDLPRNYFEIITVKNFYEESIDKFIVENGIQSYYTDKRAMGAKIKIGIENSRGNILCFLDDDDMFSKDKLKEVSDYLTRSDESLFYNSRILIDERGNTIGNEILEDKKLVVSSKKEINYLFQHKIYFNSSSMCVKKEVLEEKLKYLDQIERLADNFILLSAIEHNGKIRIVSKPLTFYRVHQSSSRHIEKDFNKFIQERISYWNEVIHANELLLKIFTNELALYAIECSKKMAEFQRCLIEGKRCIQFINCGTFERKTLLLSNIISLISIFAPQFPRQLIFKRYAE